MLYPPSEELEAVLFPALWLAWGWLAGTGSANGHHGLVGIWTSNHYTELAPNAAQRTGLFRRKSVRFAHYENCTTTIVRMFIDLAIL